MRRRLPPRGFTLMEVLVAVAVVGALATVAVLSYMRAAELARSTEAVENLGAIRTGEFVHRVEHGAFVEAIDLPAINAQFDLGLTARYFSYEVADADAGGFLAVATRTDQDDPLVVTMDQTGKITYLWPKKPAVADDATQLVGATAQSGSGGGGGGGGGGAGFGVTGGGGGGSGAAGGSGGGGGGGGGIPVVGDVDRNPGGVEPAPVTGGDPAAVEPNIADGPYAALMEEVFNLLADDGTLAQSLADFLVLHQIELAFQSLGGGVLGTIGPSSSWWVPQDNISQVILDTDMAVAGWPAAEIAAILAHEAHHITQVYGDLFTGFPADLLWLEDVEGPAYVVETQVWDSLRRDALGNIVLTADPMHNDWDFRADSFILPDGTVDVASHNAYITSTRGITPNTPFF